MEPITVLLVDDHEIVRQGVSAALTVLQDIEIIGEAANGAAAVHLAAEHAPDVVLMDLIMPEMDGIEATRQLKRVSPNSQIIILTSYHEDQHIFPAIQAGALSYVLKDIDAAGLAQAIRQAARGEATLNPQVAARLIAGIREQHRDSGPGLTELSEREKEVLGLIAQGQRNSEIAETLTLSPKTVKRHVSNILSKLHLADRTQAAVFAWRNGLVD